MPSPNHVHVAQAAEVATLALKISTRNGVDGRDAALGHISAIRMFVLEYAALGQIHQELRELARILEDGE